MMDPKLQDRLLEKVGGTYKLVSLVQKRMRELVRGLPPLTEAGSDDPWDIAAREILEGKIELLTGEEAEKIRKEIAAREAEEEKNAAAKKAPAQPPAAPQKEAS